MQASTEEINNYESQGLKRQTFVGIRDRGGATRGGTHFMHGRILKTEEGRGGGSKGSRARE